MSINSMHEVAESYKCDSCGKIFYERKDCSLTFRVGGNIAFEWWNHGDYCPECLRKLANGIVGSLPVAERYAADSLKTPMELEVINSQ